MFEWSSWTQVPSFISMLTEALRFLETHKPELMAKFIREDVEWGLYGQRQRRE